MALALPAAATAARADSNADQAALLAKIAAAASADAAAVHAGRRCDPDPWKEIAEDPALASLNGAMKSSVYLQLAVCVGGPKRPEWLRLATEQPGALPQAWSARFVVAAYGGDIHGALDDLEAAANAYKAAHTPLAIPDDEAVSRIGRGLINDPPSRRRMMAALDDGGWTPSDHSNDPSGLWLSYSLMLLEAGDQTGAARVAHKVTRAEILFGMKLDKRFDGIRAAEPGLFDLKAATYAAVDRAQRTYANATNDNSAKAVIDALRDAGRLPEALAFADSVLSKPKLVDAHGLDYRNWIEDRRAYVLMEMGRFNDAIGAEKSAAAQPEQGRPNVSQVINLAEMQLDTGAYREALATVKPMDEPGRASPYGRMFVAEIRACAYAELGRMEEARLALAATVARPNDNRGARLKALLCVGDIADATALVISWLGDPLAREQALIELCPGGTGPHTALQVKLSKRFREVRADLAVQAAIARVGHTEPVDEISTHWVTYS
jgi:tetratricopeptide (TPR) repeat protein